MEDFHSDFEGPSLIAVAPIHLQWKDIMGRASRAEDDPVVGSAGAGECARGIILWVTVRVRAPGLEKSRVISWSTFDIVAAVLRSLEHSTRVIAPSRSFQRLRTLSIDIRGALDPTAPPAGGAEIHGDVETINKRYIEKVLVTELVQGVFCQCIRWRTPALAVQDPATVSGLAPATATSVEVAVGSTPDTCHLGASRNVERPCLASVQATATTW